MVPVLYFLIKIFVCSRPFSAVLVPVLEVVRSNSVSLLAVETPARTLKAKPSQCKSM